MRKTLKEALQRLAAITPRSTQQICVAFRIILGSAVVPHEEDVVPVDSKYQ